MKMRKIKEENIKIGNFIYIIRKDSKDRRYIIKILSEERKSKDTRFWKLKIISKKTSIIFDEIEFKSYCPMSKEIWERYDLYKLNKKEIEKFNRVIILEDLK